MAYFLKQIKVNAYSERKTIGFSCKLHEIIFCLILNKNFEQKLRL